MAGGRGGRCPAFAMGISLHPHFGGVVMVPTNRTCPDCDVPQGSADEPLNGPLGVNRREFLWTVGATAGAAVASSVLPGRVLAANAAKSEPESVVKVLFESLSSEQKKTVCFDWDHQEQTRGLLRTHVSNNWHITKPQIN